MTQPAETWTEALVINSCDYKIDPQPLPQLSPTRLQSSAECWYPHQKANNQSRGDCDTNQQPSQAWNKEGIQPFRTEQITHLW